MKKIVFAHASVFALLVLLSDAEAAPLSINFESPAYTLGAIAGQDGWSGPGTIVSSALTRFGMAGGAQSVLADASMSRSVSISVTTFTPFSFLWDWSPTFPGNSRFAEFEIDVSGARIARFGADLSGGGTTSHLYAYGLVPAGGSTSQFNATDPVLRPVYSVSGVLDFSTQTYDVTFTDLGTSVAYPFTGLNMLTLPTLAAAQADTVFTTTTGIEGNHYLDNVSFGNVPEPATILLLGVGMMALVGTVRHRV
jgi:hypothetical protein